MKWAYFKELDVIVSTKEAAQMIGKTPQTVRDLTKSGALRVINLKEPKSKSACYRASWVIEDYIRYITGEWERDQRTKLFKKDPERRFDVDILGEEVKTDSL